MSECIIVAIGFIKKKTKSDMIQYQVHLIQKTCIAGDTYYKVLSDLVSSRHCSTEVF